MPERYSQFDEQKYITSYFDGTKGRFLDIGASDGIVNSNTRRLVELEWNGVLVEPDARAFGNLVQNNAQYPHLTLVNAGIGNENGLAEFVMYVDSSLSSFAGKQIQTLAGSPKVRIVLAPRYTWEYLLLAVGDDFDFISIDAEGASFEILRKLPFELLPQLKMICIEYDVPEKEITEFMKQKGFQVLMHNGLNGIYVK